MYGYINKLIAYKCETYGYIDKLIAYKCEMYGYLNKLIALSVRCMATLTIS